MYLEWDLAVCLPAMHAAIVSVLVSVSVAVAVTCAVPDGNLVWVKPCSVDDQAHQRANHEYGKAADDSQDDGVNAFDPFSLLGLDPCFLVGVVRLSPVLGFLLQDLVEASGFFLWI